MLPCYCVVAPPWRNVELLDRAGELSLVRGRLAEATARSCSHLMLVRGEARIGKTALLRSTSLCETTWRSATCARCAAPAADASSRSARCHKERSAAPTCVDDMTLLPREA